MSTGSRRNFIRLSSMLMLGTAFPTLRALGKSITPFIQIQRSAFTMGSIVTITAYSPDKRECELAIDEAFREMKEIDRLMSVFNPDSQLSAINQCAGEKEVGVNFRIIEVIECAQKVHHLTGGAFDITIEPLMKLYGFRDEETGHPFPSDQQIVQTLAGVGMENVFIDKSRLNVVLANHQTRLDFGGIAVGYAIDRAAQILKSHGVESALINHSGDLCALGSPPDENGWEIGITAPEHTDNIITTIRIKDRALCTSGNYRNFIESDGKHIGHILNPRNGKTASSILSGTTIAETAIKADAFSTGFFVSGIEQSGRIIKSENNLQFIAVVGNGGKERVLRL